MFLRDGMKEGLSKVLPGGFCLYDLGAGKLLLTFELSICKNRNAFCLTSESNKIRQTEL